MSTQAEEEEITRCPQCDGKQIEMDFTVIETHCDNEHFLDINNAEHYHNEERFVEDYECLSCNHRWEVKLPHECWCGWIQEVKGSGYQGPRRSIDKPKSEPLKKDA